MIGPMSSGGSAQSNRGDSGLVRCGKRGGPARESSGTNDHQPVASIKIADVDEFLTHQFQRNPLDREYLPGSVENSVPRLSLFLQTFLKSQDFRDLPTG